MRGMIHGLARHGAASTLACILVGSAGAASAQVAPSGGAPGSLPPTADVGDGDIVVTAQRRSERLKDVPASVAIVTGDALAASGVSRFQDLGRVVPGVIIVPLGTTTQPAIRGVTSVAATIGGENNVGIYVDGFFQVDQIAVNQDFANVANVQVLKGPQGSLYGRNATGGAILITTRDPGNEFAGDVRVSYGKRNDTRLQATLDLPIIAERLTLGIAGYLRRDDGYIKDLNGFTSAPLAAGGSKLLKTAGNDAAPFRNRSLRTKLKATPADGVSLTLGYNYSYIDDARAVAYQVVDYPSAGVRAVLNGTEPTTNGLRQAFRQRDRVSVNFRPRVVSKSHEYTALLSIETGDFGVLASHTAYFEKADHQLIDFDGSPRQSVVLGIENRRHSFTQALDYQFTGVDGLSLLAGAFYLHDKARGVILTSGLFSTLPQPVPLARTNNFLNTPYSFAGYVDGTFDLSSKLFLTLGARYTVERKSVGRTDAAVVFVPGPTFGTLGPDVDQRGAGQPPAKTFRAFTPRAVLRYAVSPDTSVYASFSRGFKSGTFNVGAAPLNPVRPEKITGYEAGIKTQSRSFRAELSGFYYDYKDLQLAKVFIDQNNIIRTGTNNAANSEIYGVDASFSKDFGPLTLYAGAAYLHARYKDYADATSFDIRVTSAGDLFVANNAANNTQDWSGLQMIRSPAFSGNIGARYSLPLAGGNLLLAGNANFSTRFTPRDDSLLRYVCTAAGNPAVGTAFPGGAVTTPCLATGQTIQATGKRRFVQKGYILGSLSADWTSGDSRFSFGVFANNVLNTRYKIFYTSATTMGDVATYNEPRQFGIRGGLKF